MNSSHFAATANVKCWVSLGRLTVFILQHISRLPKEYASVCAAQREIPSLPQSPDILQTLCSAKVSVEMIWYTVIKIGNTSLPSTASQNDHIEILHTEAPIPPVLKQVRFPWQMYCNHHARSPTLVSFPHNSVFTTVGSDLKETHIFHTQRHRSNFLALISSLHRFSPFPQLRRLPEKRQEDILCIAMWLPGCVCLLNK